MLTLGCPFHTKYLQRLIGYRSPAVSCAVSFLPRCSTNRKRGQKDRNNHFPLRLRIKRRTKTREPVCKIHFWQYPKYKKTKPRKGLSLDPFLTLPQSASWHVYLILFNFTSFISKVFYKKMGCYGMINIFLTFQTFTWARSSCSLFLDIDMDINGSLSSQVP